MIIKYFMGRKNNTLPVLCTMLALLLVGCGGGTTTAPSSSPTATSSSTTARATLKHEPNGTADLNWDPSSHNLTVKISLTGLAPSSTHPSHIHTGSCSNQGGIIYPLKNLNADAHGTATMITTISNVTKGIPASGWSINVHNGPGLSPDEQFLPIVCSDVSNPNASTSAAQSLHLTMIAAPGASKGQAATGMAQLTLSGGMLTVKVNVSGLEPNSAHAAHIHAGSCESQGPVVYPLTVVKADASGNASATTTINNISSIPGSGWYVNVHRTTDLSTQTGFDPVACGNVTVG